MKTFKNYLNEDVEILRQTGLRGDAEETQHDFKYKPEDFEKPVNSIGQYDVYQFHHGYGDHKGFGKFHDLLDVKEKTKYTGEGGRFGVFHRPTGQIAGYVKYHMNPARKEIEVQDLKGVEGHRGVRSMLYDTITDHLGYTLVADRKQTDRGMRGWEEDIASGKNIKVRYYHGHADLDKTPHEVAAQDVPHEHIWASRNKTIPHPKYPSIKLEPDLVELVRYPKHKY